MQWVYLWLKEGILKSWRRFKNTRHLKKKKKKSKPDILRISFTLNSRSAARSAVSFPFQKTVRWKWSRHTSETEIASKLRRAENKCREISANETVRAPRPPRLRGPSSTCDLNLHRTKPIKWSEGERGRERKRGGWGETQPKTREG